MNPRLGKMRRVLAVQTLLERLADWRLRDLESQARALQDQRRELVRFLDGESAFTGLFAAAALRRVESLEGLCEALRKEREAQALRRLEERGRMRRAERTAYALEAEAREMEEADQRAEAIERAVNRRA